MTTAIPSSSSLSSTAAKPTAEQTSNAGRTRLEPMLHRVAQRPACIRSAFDFGPESATLSRQA